MMKKLTILTLLALAWSIGCDGAGDSGGSAPADAVTEDSMAVDTTPEDPADADGVEPLGLELTDPPIELDGLEADFAADVPYGDDPLQVFDVLLPVADAPTPLVVFIHGGGFTGGDKSGAWDRTGEVIAALEAGVAYASVNYRLLGEIDDVGVLKPLGDSARCLQFLRAHAGSLNIDPARVVLYGGSAGAGTSLWLGFHDDMAEPQDPDPVRRQSTRVLAVGALETQATYDLVRWATDVFAEYGITFELVFGFFPELEQRLNSFYGVDDFADLESEEIQAYRADVDMLALMSEDDPPMYVSNENIDATMPMGVGAFFHHPNHAWMLKERALEVGLEHIAHIPKLDLTDETETEVIRFLLDRLAE